VFFGPEVTVKFEILNISSSSKGNETKVLMERIVHFKASGSKISLPAMAIFEVNGKGKITGWRDYFDRSQAGLSP
jgi:limonene-1,2-epoxide hydrolase